MGVSTAHPAGRSKKKLAAADYRFDGTSLAFTLVGSLSA
jgi:hypothetical protein